MSWLGEEKGAALQADAPGGDTVNVTKAEYRAKNRRLKVEVTSDAAPDATLQVYSTREADGSFSGWLGQIGYVSRRNFYTLVAKNTDNPGTVWVVSDLGGEASKVVTVR